MLISLIACGLMAMLPSLIARWCVGRLLIIAWPTRFVSFVIDFSDVVMLLGDLQMPLRKFATYRICGAFVF